MVTFQEFYDYFQTGATNVLRAQSSAGYDSNFGDLKLFLQQNRGSVMNLLTGNSRFSERCLTQAEMGLYGHILKAGMHGRINLDQFRAACNEIDRRTSELQSQQIGFIRQESPDGNLFQKFGSKVGYALTTVYGYYLDVLSKESASDPNPNGVLLPGFQEYGAQRLLPLYNSVSPVLTKDIRPFHLQHPSIKTFPQN